MRILDFFNDAQDILESFLPYYNRAELSDVSDAQIVYDIQTRVDQEQIYHWSEVEAFAAAFFNPKAPASQLTQYCYPARDRFAKRYRAIEEERRQAREARRHAEDTGDTVGVKHADHRLTEAGEALDNLDLFCKNLQSFVRAYEFLSQIVDYEDRELEQLNLFAKHLYPLLRIDRLDDDDVDVSELALTHYRLTKRAEQELILGERDQEYGLKPMSEVGSGAAHDPEKKLLSEIIEALNELFGAETSDEDKLHYAKGIADRVSREFARLILRLLTSGGFGARASGGL
ncbi:MAG: hypothetical protein PF508_13570 [Spirochaeta sp.]|nr:hypothetical protein [Spirochaeta sp.]